LKQALVVGLINSIQQEYGIRSFVFDFDNDSDQTIRLLSAEILSNTDPHNRNLSAFVAEEMDQ